MDHKLGWPTGHDPVPQGSQPRMLTINTMTTINCGGAWRTRTSPCEGPDLQSGCAYPNGFHDPLYLLQNWMPNKDSNLYLFELKTRRPYLTANWAIKSRRVLKHQRRLTLQQTAILPTSHNKPRRSMLFRVSSPVRLAPISHFRPHYASPFGCVHTTGVWDSYIFSGAKRRIRTSADRDYRSLALPLSYPSIILVRKENFEISAFRSQTGRSASELLPDISYLQWRPTLDSNQHLNALQACVLTVGQMSHVCFGVLPLH